MNILRRFISSNVEGESLGDENEGGITERLEEIQYRIRYRFTGHTILKFINSIDLLFRDGSNLPYVGEAAPPVHYSLGKERFADIVSAAQPIERSAQQIWQLFAVHGVLTLLLKIHKNV